MCVTFQIVAFFLIFSFNLVFLLRADNFVYYFSTITHNFWLYFFHLKTTTSRTNADSERKRENAMISSTFNRNSQCGLLEMPFFNHIDLFLSHPKQLECGFLRSRISKSIYWQKFTSRSEFKRNVINSIILCKSHTKWQQKPH